MELLPHAHSMFSPWLLVVGTIQIIYAALTSLGADRGIHVETNSIFLPLTIAKILKSLADVENPGLIFLGKQVCLALICLSSFELWLCMRQISRSCFSVLNLS
jgi:hypothetical protein